MQHFKLLLTLASRNRRFDKTQILEIAFSLALLFMIPSRAPTKMNHATPNSDPRDDIYTLLDARKYVQIGLHAEYDTTISLWHK